MTAAGTMRVRSPREIDLQIDADEADRAWLRREIASMVGHRWPVPYEATDGRRAPILPPDDGHILGRRIRGAAEPDTFYRVREGQIRQVVRTLGETRFAITMQEHLTTGDGRILPTEYTVST